MSNTPSEQNEFNGKAITEALEAPRKTGRVLVLTENIRKVNYRK